MFCENCGAKIDDTQSYCPACGAGMNVPGKKKRGGKKAFLIIILILIIGLASGVAVYAVNFFSPESRTARFMQQGDEYYGDRDYYEAIESYRAALLITPDSVESYKGIAKAYEKLEDTQALMEVLEEAYDATGDKYFKKELAKLDEELRRADIEMAETIRVAVLTDIAEGNLTGNGEFKVKKGSPTLLDETPEGCGAPALGYNYYVLYDAPSGTVYVALNGFVLSTEDGAQEYLDYDGKPEDRSDDLVWPPLPCYDITPDEPDVVTSADGRLDEVGEITLDLWCSMTDNEANRHALERALDDLAEIYPNVKINWEAFDYESYKIKLKAAVAANELPDIFVTPTGSFLGDFADTGRILCLDDAYEDYRDELPECMLDTSTFGGKHYGVPYTMHYIVLFANMDLLKEAGYDEIPSTYNDLVECCEALKKKKITPFGVAGMESWCVSEFVESIMLQTVGADTLSDMFYGFESWDNEGIAQSVNVFQSWNEAGYFDPSGGSITYNEVLSCFERGDYAFMVTGSWNCLDIATVADYEVGISCLPVFDSGKADEGYYIGGPSEVLSVSSGSLYPQAASQYAFELGRLISHYGFPDWSGLPAWEIYGDTSDLEELYVEAAEMSHEANGFVLYGDVALDSDDLSIYLSYMSHVFDGNIDGQGFIEGLAEDIY